MTIIYSYKCMRCGLHFNVYSWENDWSWKYKAFCPECGTQGAGLLRQEETNKEIFQFVSAGRPDVTDIA